VSGADDDDDERAPAGVITRRQLLRTGGVAAGLLATGDNALGAVRRVAGGRPAGPEARTSAAQVLRFRSRPDLLPPAVRVNVAAHRAAPGYLFMGPHGGPVSQAGSLILDDSGEPVYFQPVASKTHWISNVGVQTYRDKPVMVIWEGTIIEPGYGHGTVTLLDQSYRRLLRVRAAQGRWIDLHEFQLTPQGTALFTCHPPTVDADLSSVGGPKQGQLIDSVFQEVDLRTGRLLLEWRGRDHISISESYLPVEHPWDYLHLNSLDVLPDGNLLASARHTFALYKLDRKTGNVIWRMGGKRSDFHMGPGTGFALQHDARHVGDSRRTGAGAGAITLFDDAAKLDLLTGSQSRGMMLEVDYVRRTASLAHEFLHPDPLLATAMGNVQTLPDGHVVVGWGTVPLVTEFTLDGTVLFDMQAPGACSTYREFRFPWTGIPKDPPAIATRGNRSTGETVLYASWNGATEVAKWQVLGGSTSRQLRPVHTVVRQGFETAIKLGRVSGYVAVAALDGSGRRLATSATTKI
jgi:Arylsulfotransferase (ASST)